MAGRTKRKGGDSRKGVRRSVGSFYAERLKEFWSDGRFGRSPGSGTERLRRLARRAAVRVDLRSRRFWTHQNEATGAILDHFRSAVRDPQTIAVIPTAGGKTEIFLRLVDAFCESGKGTVAIPNTIVLVPTQHLIEQTLRRAAADYPGLPTGYIASKPAYDADGEPIAQGIRPVTVMTYEGFVALVNEGRIRARDVDFLVLDEAHRALSELRREVFGAFIGNTLIAGFTATPAFNDEQDLHLLLGAENEVIRVSAKRLRNEGILAPAVNYVYAVSIEGSAPKGGAGSPAMKRLSVRSALDFYESYRDPDTGKRMIGKPTLCYCSDIEQARIAESQFNRRFRAKGLKSAVLTGKDTSARQGRVLARLAAGEIHAVMNVKLLQEGIDIPCVRNIVNFAATSSAVRANQRGGRGVRWDFGDPDADQTVSILDCFVEENGAPLGSPRFYFETIDDPDIARLVRRTRTRDYATRTAEPKKKPKRKPARFELAPHLSLVAYLRAMRDGGVSVLGGLDEREEGWLSKSDLATRLGAASPTAYRRLSRAWRSLISGFDPRGYCSFEGRRVAARFVRSNRRKTFCLKAGEVAWFCARFGFEDRSLRLPTGPVAVKTADWKTLSETRNHFKTSTLNREIVALFATWHEDLLAGRKPKLGHRLVRVEFRRGGAGVKVCIHKSALKALAEHIGLQYGRSDSDWLRRDRLRELAGEGVDRILNGIMEDLVAGRPPTVAGTAIRAKLLGEDRIIRVHRSGLHAIMRQMRREQA